MQNHCCCENHFGNGATNSSQIFKNFFLQTLPKFKETKQNKKSERNQTTEHQACGCSTVTLEWNPLLPDKSRSEGWSSSLMLLKSILKWQPGDWALTPILGEKKRSFYICGMYQTSLHWFTWSENVPAKLNILSVPPNKLQENTTGARIMS